MAKGSREWFRLDHLLDSVLADVVAADANFQLTQAAAWRDFSKSVNELSQMPTVQDIDLSVGFGRLENLGLSELSVDLPLEVFTPGLFRRTWWGLIKLFGVQSPEFGERFRLAKTAKHAELTLHVKAKRNALGRWEIAESEAE